MNQVDLTYHPFIESFCEFKIDGVNVDLHNDFHCTSVRFSNKSKALALSFSAINSALGLREVIINFEDIVIDTLDFQPSNEDQGFWTIDVMYRGRFESNEQGLSENLDGRNFYYINFYENNKIELFAKTVIGQVF